MYAIHKDEKIINTNEHEIKKFVSLHMVMGIIRCPRLRIYWTPATRIKFIEDLQISRNRFELLRNKLQITDINAEASIVHS